MRIKEL